MIDTIRFKIPTTHEIYSLVKSKSKQRFVINTTTQLLEFYISTKDIEIGSYDYHINIIATKNVEDTIFLEFSIPKVFYGHNIYLYYPSIEPVLKVVQDAMEKAFNLNLANYSSWIIQRLDICYAWRLKTQEEAYLAFLVLNPYDYSRKNKVSFDTSFENKGSSFDFKGYLKFDEFKKHDFKRFHKLKRFDLAYDFLELSKGVFRIELTMRKKKLKAYFKKELTYRDIDDTILLQKILREHFSKYLKHADTKVIKENEVLVKLFTAFTKSSKALNLYSFYNSWNHPNPSIRARNRNLYKKRLNPSTLWRKHKDLKIAKVGIPGYDLKFDFDFSIPSPFVVNTDNAPAASAAERSV
jgi:hypothetical protein